MDDALGIDEDGNTMTPITALAYILGLIPCSITTLWTFNDVLVDIHSFIISVDVSCNKRCLFVCSRVRVCSGGSKCAIPSFIPAKKT